MFFPIILLGFFFSFLPTFLTIYSNWLGGNGGWERRQKQKKTKIPHTFINEFSFQKKWISLLFYFGYRWTKSCVRAQRGKNIKVYLSVVFSESKKNLTTLVSNTSCQAVIQSRLMFNRKSYRQLVFLEIKYLRPTDDRERKTVFSCSLLVLHTQKNG